MAGQESTHRVCPGEMGMAGAAHAYRSASLRRWFTAAIAAVFVVAQLPVVLPPLLAGIRQPGMASAGAAVKLAEVIGILLLAAYLIIRLAERPLSRHLAFFLAALLVINLRYYLVGLLPGIRLVGDATGLFALYLVFVSQVAAVPQSGRRWRRAARALLAAGLALMAVLDAAARNAVSAVAPASQLYEVVFAAFAVAYVVFLLVMYRHSASVSLDVGVRWRFWLLVAAAFWYILLHVYEFERRSHYPTVPGLLFWTNVFAALGILSMLAAFLMPRWLEGFLLWLQDRVSLAYLHNDLIFLAGFISEKLPSAQEHPLVRLSEAVAERLAFTSQEKQVLRTAAGLVVLSRPRTWANVGLDDVGDPDDDEKAVFRPTAAPSGGGGVEPPPPSVLIWPGNPTEYPGDGNVARKYRNRLAVLRRVATVLRHYERWWPHLEAGRRPWAGRVLIPREAAVLTLVHLHLRQKNNHRGCFPPSMVEALGFATEKRSS